MSIILSDGTRVDPASAIRFEEVSDVAPGSGVMSSSNRVCRRLYFTACGRWILQSWEAWQASQKFVEVISSERAAEWIRRNSSVNVSAIQALPDAVRNQIEPDSGRYYPDSDKDDRVARMTGSEFESFVAALLQRLGYHSIAFTQLNDLGGDVLCTSPAGGRTVIQAKRWKQPVGIAVVQEILGAMLYYECGEGIIITNSRFTNSARLLASKDFRIKLYDGRWIEQRLIELG